MALNIFGSGKRIRMLEAEVKQLSTLRTYLQSQISFNSGLQTINDSVAYYPDLNTLNQTETYSTNDHIYSVINKIAETTSLIPFYTYLIKPDRKALRRYEAITNRQLYTTKGIFDIMLLQAKALEDAPENDPLEKILDTPNPFQSKQDFFLALYAFYLLNGEAFIYKFRLGEGANKGKPSQLYIFPPECVIMHVTSVYPYTVTGYDFRINGIDVLKNIPVTDIIHVKKFNPVLNYNGSDLRGLSTIKVLCKPITRLDSADKTSTAQLQNGGLPGIVFDDSFQDDNTITQEAFDLQRKAFYNFVNEPDNKGAAFFTGGKKGYIQTGLKLADMELIQLQKIDFARLCNAYKISDQLFNNNDRSTFNNLGELVRQMYTNACLPLAYIFRDALNKGLASEFSDKPRTLDIDISGITELQDDMKQLAEVYAAMPGGFSMNELRVAFKYDESPDPLMNKIIIKQGYTFLDDMSGGDIPPVDPELRDAGY